jgi:hypothetical protein
VPPGIPQALAPLEAVGKQILAWIGAALVFIGTIGFLDTKGWTVSNGIFSISFSRNFWDWAPFWGAVILILSLAVAAIAFLRDYKWLLPAGGLLLLILILEFLYTFSTGVSASGVSAHPVWLTWIILFAGALAILAAAAMRPNPRDNPDDHGVERLLAQSRNRTGTR